MDPDTLSFVLSSIPALASCPPDPTEIVEFLSYVLIICTMPPPDPLLDTRYRLFSPFQVFGLFSNERSVYEITGETRSSIISMKEELSDLLGQDPRHIHKLLTINRIFLFLIWLRSYPSYYFLSMLFGVSVSTIHREIACLIPIFRAKFSMYIKWASYNDWRTMRGVWPTLSSVVGAIDGTSGEIYRPQIVPQRLFYSGHRHYHAIHAQVVVDNSGLIRYIESGFPGHQNDAQQFHIMRSIGQNSEFSLPLDCFLLADKIYPNIHPLLTPYTITQIHRQPARMQRKFRKFNRLHARHRMIVEHSIGEIKRYCILRSLWRHPREELESIVVICAGLCNKKKLST
ncbi:hypothetical protein FSP39_019847 [Pinctada imbricata]|uniref:DDE Tnp4 domain-containing protein n=1 Tax=Pinctada imbricata TaxID=66713 RepID=A0AA88YIZ8_PINIB|nr:hypothetical protein FSP39_019847 [Pinctada imbricata]